MFNNMIQVFLRHCFRLAVNDNSDMFVCNYFSNNSGRAYFYRAVVIIQFAISSANVEWFHNFAERNEFFICDLVCWRNKYDA